MVTVNDVNENPVDCDKYPNNETCTKLGYNRIKNANISTNEKGWLGVLGLGGKRSRKTKKTTKKKTSKKHRHKTTKNKK